MVGPLWWWDPSGGEIPLDIVDDMIVPTCQNTGRHDLGMTGRHRRNQPLHGVLLAVIFGARA